MPTVKPKRKKVKVTVTKTKNVSSKTAPKSSIEADLNAVVSESVLTPPILKVTPKKENVAKVSSVKPVRTNASRPKFNIYRKIAYSFIVLTIALIAVIVYFSFVGVTITLTPKKEPISSDLTVSVYDKNKNLIISEEDLSGVVEQVEVEASKSYQASGTEVIGKETSGKVTIINNYNKNQPLVANTRLLTSDNKLFRIKETINVPAGGSLEVEVFADEPSAEMAIGPSKFIIPGLWAGIQDKIYAESKEAMVFKEKTKKRITQADIDTGIVDLKQSLLVKAESEIGMNYKDYDKVIYDIVDNSIDIKVDGKVGEERGEFTITIKTGVVVIAFDEQLVKDKAEEKLMSVIASDRELSKFDKNNIVYSLNDYSLEEGTAKIEASFGGEIVVKSGEEVIDRNEVLGLSRTQLKSYLESLPQISEYEVSFSPSFVNKVPNLADRVKIEIKNIK